jgi:hypothetical protein
MLKARKTTVKIPLGVTGEPVEAAILRMSLDH